MPHDIKTKSLPAEITTSFMDSFRAGSVQADQIDDAVSDWHAGAGAGQTLGSFLGMTPDEYSAWMRDASALVAMKGNSCSRTRP